MQAGGIDGVLDRWDARAGNDVVLQRKLGEVSERLGRDAEEVLVKASGRAMEQALRVGEWFRNREDEVLTRVEVRCGSVSVVDDIVEKGQDDEVDDGRGSEDKENEDESEPTLLEGGDTTLELLRNLEGKGTARQTETMKPLDDLNGGEESGQDLNGKKATNDGGQLKKKRKRKRKEYDPDDMPEARLRWVKTVEVAISLRA